MNLPLFWIYVGIFTMLAEFIIPGFIVFFFGIGALLTGAVAYFAPALPLAGQIILWLLSSLLVLFLTRRYFLKGDSRTGELSKDEEEFSGETGKVTETITAIAPGKVFFHGSTWNAEGEPAQEIPAGTIVRICKRKNITLIVSPK